MAGVSAELRKQQARQRLVKPRARGGAGRPAERADAGDEESQSAASANRPRKTRIWEEPPNSAKPKAMSAQPEARSAPSGQNARENRSAAITSRVRRMVRLNARSRAASVGSGEFGPSMRPASGFPHGPGDAPRQPIHFGMVSRSSISSKLGRARTTAK